MLVTPHIPAKIGQSAHFGASVEPFPGINFDGLLEDIRARNQYPLEHSNAFFVDWLSLRQDHIAGGLPVVCCGVVMSTDEDGQMQWKTIKAQKIEGSFDTSVQLRCDGVTVHFSGNVSRFCRSNNLFGFSLTQCLAYVNEILARYNLPPFTEGEKFYRNVKTEKGHCLRPAWTGASITRIDLTSNFETGSLADARAYMEWLSTQQGNARLKVGTHGDGETVDWGRGSRNIYSKVYLKSSEIRRHGGDEKLIDYCESVGLIRFEVTVKSTMLHYLGCNYLGGLHMAQLELLFEDRKKVLTRAEHEHDELEELPRALRCTARDYLAGDNLAARLSERTFRRHRAALLPFGLDIAVRRNVINFKPRVRVIEVRPATVPDWYDFKRIAA